MVDLHQDVNQRLQAKRSLTMFLYPGNRNQTRRQRRLNQLQGNRQVDSHPSRAKLLTTYHNLYCQRFRRPHQRERAPAVSKVGSRISAKTSQGSASKDSTRRHGSDLVLPDISCSNAAGVWSPPGCGFLTRITRYSARSPIRPPAMRTARSAPPATGGIVFPWFGGHLTRVFGLRGEQTDNPTIMTRPWTNGRCLATDHSRITVRFSGPRQRGSCRCT